MTVPACLNPLMLAMGGDPLDELGKIERSVRLRRSASACFSRTPASSGDRKKWTLSLWVKLAKVSTAIDLLSYYVTGINETISLGADGSISRYCADTNGTINRVLVSTTALHRDGASFMHVVVAQDTSIETSTERVKVHRNGLRAQVNASVLPSLNFETYLNAAVPHVLGGGNAGFFDGLLAHIAFIDGAALEPTAFGMFHPKTGQWRPKSRAAIRAAVKAVGGSVRNGWGTNGFFLPFDDAASLTTLGYDRSQSDTDTTGNNWTPTNISLTAGVMYDSMLDTPTNNYPTLNPLWKESGVTISDGNLTVVSGGNRGGVSTFPAPTGGRYWFEVTVTATVTTRYISIFKAAAMNGSIADIDGGSGAYAYSYYPNGTKFVKGTNSAYGSSWGAIDDVIGVAVNLVDNTVTFYKNGVSQGAITIDAGVDYFFGGSNATADAGSLAFNFGQRPFSYTPPAGFKALCTKNLPFPKIANPKSAFVSVTDTGANIAATLAAKRSGWPTYIDIIKRRDGTEGWRWIFADDAANYLDSSSSGAKAAVPSFSGTAYVGYSLKVSPANGVATGRLTHVTGTADVVVDGLANSRKAVILKNEGTGIWYFYHPDLTAGKLLYLEQNAAETTDATIGSVNSSGFTVAAALASGTYRWISLAETGGFLKLGKYAGNSSSDGPVALADFTPALFLEKNYQLAGTNFEVFDNARNPSNVCDKTMLIGNAAGDNGINAHFVDFVAGGTKIRTGSATANSGDLNYLGYSHVYLSIAAFPFRYANAR